ncbi:CMRF35-like molecule 7 [Hoplias malabaricus]|uniref:CMRF35-like molecule 7 n=1 Tax=Hoplias malabaricus TaxID=27720 RepID=UPI003462F322
MKLRVLCCLLFVVVRDAWSVVKLRGRVDGNLNISCYHSWASTNIKYLCRSNCRDKDILIRSAGVGKTARKGRYSLYDRGAGHFIVTIGGLWMSDSGRYWCGVERLGLDTFHEVFITVLDAPQTRKPPPTYTAENGILSTGRHSYIPVGVIALLLIVVLPLGLHYKRENACNRLRACFSSMSQKSTRSGINPDHAVTTPGDHSPCEDCPDYQNLETSIIQSNPVYQAIHTPAIQSDLLYDNLISTTSQLH